MIKFLFTILILLILQSCAPLIGAAGIASLGSASKEKGIGISLSDTNELEDDKNEIIDDNKIGR